MCDIAPRRVSRIHVCYGGWVERIIFEMASSAAVRFGGQVYDEASHWRVVTLELRSDEYVSSIVQYHMDGVKLRGVQFHTNRGNTLVAGSVHPELEPGRPLGERRLTKQHFEAINGQMVVGIHRLDDAGHDQWPGCGLIKRIDCLSILGLASAPPAPHAAASRVDDELDAACVVCMDAPSEVLFLPCAHRCTCFECARQLAECPLCRASLKKRLGMPQN